MSADLKVTSTNISDSSIYKERYRKRPLLESISRMSDEEMADASVRSASKKAENSTAARVLEKGPSLFLAASAIASGVLAQGRLSDKAFSAVKMLGVGALVLSLAKPVVGAVDNAFDSFDKTKRFDEEDTKKHPILRTLTSIGALAAVTAGAVAGAGVAKDKLAQKFQPKAKEISDFLVKKADSLNSSFAGKISDKLSNSYAEFQKFHPTLANAMSNTIAILPAVSYIGGTMKLADNIEQNVINDTVSNYNKLSFAKEVATEVLSSGEEKED